MMKIAVVGSGIAGLASAYLLSRDHAVDVYEANDYLGGHVHTHEVEIDGRTLAVDSGFIISNPEHYPLFSGLLAELGVETDATTMTFAVRNERSGLEYNAGTNGGLFVQKRRAFSPRHWGMIADILKFYRESPALLAHAGPGPSLGDYLAEHRYGAAFRDDHLVPMASALWSSPSRRILEFPAKYLVAFMANHRMLQVDGRPTWRVVRGGSQAYVRALVERWHARAYTNTPVHAVARDDRGVTVHSPRGAQRYDHVVMACHADQALALLAAPTDAEREVLGALEFQPNEAVLHTDATQLPRDRRAWAAWNAIVPRDDREACTVSYCMNLLQGFETSVPVVVTLNRTHAIDPAKVLRRMQYAHPLQTARSVAAQARKHELDGRHRTWFCGAYWGYGFHEDGMRSAVGVVDLIDRLGAPRTRRARALP